MDRPITLITGTRKGIGRRLADHYLGLGHCVVGCSRKPPEAPPEGRYEHLTVDVADEHGVQKLFSHVRQKYGRLDHLINNAGIASMNHTLLTPLPDVQAILNTNVVGTFLFCREAARLMQARRFGRIVNFTTVAVPLKLEGEAIYAASKAAVLTLTHVMARELAGFGITVNAVGPVPIETDLIKGVPRKQIERLIERQAIRRMGTMEDIANVIDFFLKAESEFITGQHIYLGGI